MKSCILMVFMSCAFAIQGTLVAQTEQAANQNSRFVMTLNENLVSNLKSLGSLNSSLPQSAIGKIAAVHMQFAGASTEAASQAIAPVSVSSNVCRISLDDDIIEQARRNPIRIDLPADSQFASVFLEYVKPQSDTTEALQVNAPAASESSNTAVALQHFVKMSGTSKPMAGILELADSMKFETKFGDVDIALAQISGIRFHIDGDDAAVVVLNNGDTITGVTKSDSFILNTDWGRAEFDPVFVESITTSPNARFQQSTNPAFGARWELKGR